MDITPQSYVSQQRKLFNMSSSSSSSSDESDIEVPVSDEPDIEVPISDEPDIEVLIPTVPTSSVNKSTEFLLLTSSPNINKRPIEEVTKLKCTIKRIRRELINENIAADVKLKNISEILQSELLPCKKLNGDN